MNIGNITKVKRPIIRHCTRKHLILFFVFVFFVLLKEKSFEIFPKHNRFGFISDFFLLY